MARTFRRLQARHEYPRVLRRKDLHWSELPQFLDPRSIEGLRAIQGAFDLVGTRQDIRVPLAHSIFGY